jgi:hypothetical protein
MGFIAILDATTLVTNKGRHANLFLVRKLQIQHFLGIICCCKSTTFSDVPIHKMFGLCSPSFAKPPKIVLQVCLDESCISYKLKF